MSWSWDGTVYNIHWVQHPSKIVCLPFNLMITCWPLNVALASGVSLHKCSKVMSPCPIPTVGSKVINETSLSTWHTVHRQLPSTHPNSLNYGLQVHLQTGSITVSKLAWSQPPSVFPNWLDYGLKIRTIMVSKCIYTLARSLPPSASPNSLDYGLEVHLQFHSITAFKCISKLARLRLPSASPKSLDHGLQLHLQTCSIAASKCISKLAQLRPPNCISKLAQSRPRSVSLSSLRCHFQVHLELLSSTACSQSSYTTCRWVAI